MMRVYQTWVFESALLDENGEAKTRFRSNRCSPKTRALFWAIMSPGIMRF